MKYYYAIKNTETGDYWSDTLHGYTRHLESKDMFNTRAEAERRLQQIVTWVAGTLVIETFSVQGE